VEKKGHDKKFKKMVNMILREVKKKNAKSREL